MICDFLDIERPATTNVPLPDGAGSPLISRNIDYAANVLCVLSFISCGDWGTEAGHVLGLLGLPNKTTMGPKSFATVEASIGLIIQQLANDVVYKRNLVEEVRLCLGDKVNNDGALLFDLWQQGNLPDDQWPEITCSGDM